MMVSIRYTMKNSRGEVLENTMEGPPVNYLHGGGLILPWLENLLAGMKAGETKSVFLPEAEHDGLDDDFYIDLVIDEVRPAAGTGLPGQLAPGPADLRESECGPGCRC